MKLSIHPSHNVPGDTTAHERLERRPARIQAADRGRLSAGQEYANPVDARVPIPDIQLPSPGWERMDLL